MQNKYLIIIHNNEFVNKRYLHINNYYTVGYRMISDKRNNYYSIQHLNIV